MSKIDLDDSDPMKKLLASASHEPTVLDKCFEKMPKELKANIKDEPEKNITLSYRQPSFSSIHGTVVTKSGEKSSELPIIKDEEDPVVVFDGHSDNEAENEPIGLGVRQPSFVSLHGQIIPKGANSLADLQPVLEEVPDEAMEEIPEAEENEEEENDPQVKIVKRLQAKNANHWAEIGYEPPQDLIPLVRAKSQAQMQGQELTRNGYMTTSLSKFYTNADIDKANGKITETITEIPEEEEKKTATAVADLPIQSIPTPNRRKRSGSFGMKLGEASASMERMQFIIPEEPEEQKHDIKGSIIEEEKEEEEEPEEPEDIIEEEEEAGEEEEEGEQLFGHLNEVVTEGRDSPVYQTILTGENPPSNAIAIVKVALRKYLKIATKNNWKDEASFLSNLIDELPVSTISPMATRRQKTSAIKSRQSVSGRKSGLSTPKSSMKSGAADKESVKSEVSQSPATPSLRLQKALAKLDEDYKKESEALDEYWQSENVRVKYSRPSIDLLELRARLRKLQRNGSKEEAIRVEKKINSLEAKETADMEKAIQRDYYAADKKLKEKYAIKRETIIRTHEFKQKRQAEKNAQASVVLQVKTPSKINRDNDLLILKEMTKEVLEGKKVSEIDIEKIFTQSKRK